MTEETKPFARKPIPTFEFSVDSKRVKKGTPVTIRWNVEGAEKVTLWKSTLLPETLEPLNWGRIQQLGEEATPSGTIQDSPGETIAYYLVVLSLWGMQGRRIVVQTEKDVAPAPEPTSWCHPSPASERMLEAPQVVQLTQPSLMLQRMFIPEAIEVHLPPIPGPSPFPKPFPFPRPFIDFTTSQRYLFPGQSATLSWNIAFAGCAAMAENGQYTRLKADTSQVSGTAFDYGSFWGEDTIACSLPMSGQLEVTGPTHVWQYGSHYFVIHADNGWGGHSDRTIEIDMLPLPQFTGACTTQRVATIKGAILDIYGNLKAGCILNNATLDTTVDAFKNHDIDRRTFWGHLVTQLENLDLITFNCIEVNDNNKTWGHWDDYTNVIDLYWSPSYRPSNYAILHEFIHKCGFNGTLLMKGYTPAQIEQQAHLVTQACY